MGSKKNTLNYEVMMMSRDSEWRDKLLAEIEKKNDEVVAHGETRKRLAEALNKMKRLDEHVEDQSSKNIRLSEDNERLRGEGEEYKILIKSLEDRVELLERKNDEVVAYTETKRTLTEALDKIQRMNKDVVVQDLKIRRLVEDNDRLRAEAEQYKKSIRLFEDITKELNDKITFYEGEVARLQDNVKVYEKRHEDVEEMRRQAYQRIMDVM